MNPNDQKRVSACCSAAIISIYRFINSLDDEPRLIRCCKRCLKEVVQPCELVREGVERFGSSDSRFGVGDCYCANPSGGDPKKTFVHSSTCKYELAEPREGVELPITAMNKVRRGFLDAVLAPAEPPRPCGNENCDGEIEKVQGGHIHRPEKKYGLNVSTPETEKAIDEILAPRPEKGCGCDGPIRCMDHLVIAAPHKEEDWEERAALVLQIIGVSDHIPSIVRLIKAREAAAIREERERVRERIESTHGHFEHKRWNCPHCVVRSILSLLEPKQPE